MSEEKVEKRVESGDAVPKNSSEKKKSGGIVPFVAIILFGFLALAVISGFLNNQKLHKQIVDIERKVTTLQEGDKEIGSRVLALEDELVVISLKGRLAKIKRSAGALVNLKSLISDNQELVAKVQGLVDDLNGEEKKLEQEISGSKPKEFKASRPCQQQPCCQRCPEPVVIMHPPIPQSSAATPALTQAVQAHTAAHSKPEIKTPDVDEQGNSWWYKFINLRLFGN